MNNQNIINHYDLLISEGNDPVHDVEPLQSYMNNWDGADFVEQMALNQNKTVLEIGVGTGDLPSMLLHCVVSFVALIFLLKL